MPTTPQRDLSAPTIVIGAGPHGLAAAALLNRSGEPAVIMERSDRVGASWAQRYDHLRLHTTPSTSKLPGLSVPRQAGRWVSRDDYVRYLEGYVVHHLLDVRVATPVQRIERAEPGSKAQWLVHTPDGPVPTGAVVVATGRCHTPNIPDWPGHSTFTGTLLHLAHYRSPAPYRGQHVLVVGAGNSGTEIASVLAGAGAERVRIAVRTPPNILPRSSARWHAAGRLTEALPLAWPDRTSLLTQRLAVTDLHDLVGSLGVLDDDGQPLAVGAQTHPKASRLYFAGYTNHLLDPQPETGSRRRLGPVRPMGCHPGPVQPDRNEPAVPTVVGALPGAARDGLHPPPGRLLHRPEADQHPRW